MNTQFCVENPFQKFEIQWKTERCNHMGHNQFGTSLQSTKDDDRCHEQNWQQEGLIAFPLLLGNVFNWGALTKHFVHSESLRSLRNPALHCWIYLTALISSDFSDKTNSIVCCLVHVVVWFLVSHKQLQGYIKWVDLLFVSGLKRLFSG